MGEKKKIDMNADRLQPHRKENKLPNFENNHCWFWCLYERFCYLTEQQTELLLQENLLLEFPI